MNASVTESGHWYRRDGASCYNIGERAVTLRDARKLLLVPSVTTVLQVIDKPALTNWLIEQAIMGALTLPKIDGESDADFMRRIKVDGRAGAKAAAEEGTRIHDAIEKSFLAGGIALDLRDAKYAPHVFATRNELDRLFPDVTDWVSEKSFAHPLGYGGKVDLSSPSTGIVVDFKTKDGDFSDGKKLAYEQNVQLAAYQVGLGLVGYAEISSDSDPYDPILNRRVPDRFMTCANIFVSRTHPGKVASHVWPAEDIAKGWRIFECALALWIELKGYDPRY